MFEVGFGDPPGATPGDIDGAERDESFQPRTLAGEVQQIAQAADVDLPGGRRWSIEPGERGGVHDGRDPPAERPGRRVIEAKRGVLHQIAGHHRRARRPAIRRAGEDEDFRRLALERTRQRRADRTRSPGQQDNRVTSHRRQCSRTMVAQLAPKPKLNSSSRSPAFNRPSPSASLRLMKLSPPMMCPFAAMLSAYR